MHVAPIASSTALGLVVQHHYLHRRTSVVFSFGLFAAEQIVGVVTFGVPAARHLQIGACPSDPDAVLELNRLWVSDAMPRNSESWFLSRALALLPARIIVSYADTTRGHMGIVYRAANFRYAGWTDMERKTPRFDYITPGKHTRDAFRGGLGTKSPRVRRKPKVKYWIVTGNPTERRALLKLARWPTLSWKQNPPPTEHKTLDLP
jgi:hypothetical protein